jgi:hypothetical protein
MGKLTNGLQFTGTVGGYTAYKRKGSDEIYIRKRREKSGKSGDQLPPRVQENNSEFANCGRAAGCIRRSMLYVQHLADYNFTADLTSLATEVKVLDQVSARGQRNVFISSHPEYFAGFNLNKKKTFDSIIRHPLKYSIDADAGTANVQIPRLMQGVSLFLPWPVPQYQVIMNLGLVADQLYDAKKNDERYSAPCAMATTGWIFSHQPYEGQSFELVLPLPEKNPANTGLSYVLSIGIEMEITSLKQSGGVSKVGAAKIVDLAAVGRTLRNPQL